jgi:hypothetical protein
LQQEDQILFQILKKEITAAMRISYPGLNPEISEWKGQEITDFQEDLLRKVNGQLSEKWFYTHIKSESQALPRIDVLNMLSQYAGYLNWNDLRHKNSENVPFAEKFKKTDSVTKKIILIFLITISLLFVIFKIINTQTYRFGFIDADSGDPIISSKIQADILLKDESPVNYVSDKNGVIIFRTDQSRIRMVIRAPYYLPDTIIRVLKKFNRSEKFGLKIDSYAMMIKYFSETDIAGWQKRRDQLKNLISEEAMIFQFPDIKEGTGMELFNKQEFIDRLTMPASSLRKLEIIDSKYEHGKLVVLRFKLNKGNE